MLPERIDTLDANAAPKIAEQALDLVALAFSAEARSNGVNLSYPRAAALTMLKAAIESRLHDPNLKPVTAAAAAGISVRYANALMTQERTGLEGYIIARRLERCRRALDDPRRLAAPSATLPSAGASPTSPTSDGASRPSTGARQASTASNGPHEPA